MEIYFESWEGAGERGFTPPLELPLAGSVEDEQDKTRRDSGSPRMIRSYPSRLNPLRICLVNLVEEAISSSCSQGLVKPARGDVTWNAIDRLMNRVIHS